MVAVDVRVSGGVDEFSGLQAANLSYHHGEEGVGGNIEGNAQEHIRTALIQLAGKLSVCHIELEKAVAGRQSHLIHFSGIPGAYQHAAGIRVVLDHIHHLSQLVYAAAVGGRPGAPLVAVYRSQFSVFVGPLVPNGDPVLLQVTHVGVTGDEPQKLVNNGFEVHLFGGEEGEAIGQIEAHLVAENALRTGSGAVFLHGPVGTDMSEEV